MQPDFVDNASDYIESGECEQRDINQTNLHLNQQSISQAVRSLYTLAEHGFYSKQNLTNIYQLKPYLS